MFRSFVGALAISLLVASAAQAASPAYHAPKNALGQPDLEGFWTNATLTPTSREPRGCGYG